MYNIGIEDIKGWDIHKRASMLHRLGVWIEMLRVAESRETHRLIVLAEYIRHRL